jgi:broad specificity phosphatase PhoE
MTGATGETPIWYVTLCVWYTLCGILIHTSLRERMRMPVIYFIRHGETDWNAERRMQGRLEVPINAKGERQAARNGQLLREHLGRADGFDFVASPQLRTRRTMEIVRREMGLDPADYRTDDRLREIHKGDWQSHLLADLPTLFPVEMAAYSRDHWNVVPPGEGAESLAMMHARVCAWLTSVTRDTVVVSHGGPMRCIRRHVLGLDAESTSRLPVPQDQVLCIRDGAVSWI